ncbi:hypothetical protein F4680DRAFT_458292 [Xylaria scruposa]|nr:hypothetical protein F4680DRAFT_458292 [Xylaria scruposa]
MSVPKSLKNLFGKSNGWEMAAKVNCAILAATSVTLVALSIAAASTKNLNILFILSDNCDGSRISATNVALHLFINLLSTLVVCPFALASSNFFMQVLNAPSREELDRAHSKGSWLGIGVPSVRNGFLVSRFKTWCWIALLFSSIPIHILFNSIIFETDYRGSDFHLTIGSEPFVHNGSFFSPGASLYSGHEITDVISLSYGNSVNDTDAIQDLLKAAKHGSNWTKIDSRKCWEIYINCENLRIYRDLVVVVDQPAGWTRRDMWQLSTDQSRSWDQFVPSDEPNHLFFHARCPITDRSHNQRWPGLQPDASQLSMKYCLAETPERICHIALSPTLLLSVTVAIVTKTIIAFILTVILIRRNQPPLVTLGDAVASFIEKPDAVTAGLCTLDQRSLKKTVGSKDLLLPGPRRWRARRKRRLAAVPRSVWLSSYSLFAISISIAVYFFTDGGGLYYFSNFLPSDKNPTLRTVRDMTLTQSILLANSPQLLLSFCYLAYNNLFTRMQMAKEWAMFATAYRPLRVTHPQGEQFATYRLQLPYKYSLSLMTISITLHWLLPNAIYIFSDTELGYYDLNQTADPSLPPNTAVAVQFSESALLALIVASTALICVPVLLGLKRLPTDSINSGSNSMALSVACHASTRGYKSRNVAEASEHVTRSLSSQPLVPLPTPLSIVRNRPSEGDCYYETNANASMIITRTQTRENSEGSDSNLARISEQAISELESGCEQIKRSLKKIAQSKIRWGIVEMSPEWYTEYANNGLVEHLGFGAESDMVSPPISGNYYA